MAATLRCYDPFPDSLLVFNPAIGLPGGLCDAPAADACPAMAGSTASGIRDALLLWRWRKGIALCGQHASVHDVQQQLHLGLRPGRKTYDQYEMEFYDVRLESQR